MNRSLRAMGILWLAAGTTAWAQNASVERFQRQLEQIQRDIRLRVNPDVPPGQRMLFDYGGYLSFNFLAIDDVSQDTHTLRQYDLVGYGRLNIDNVHELFVRGRVAYSDFNSGDSFDGEGDDLETTLEQAYYRFDLARYLSAYKGTVTENNLILTAGRQFVFWANGLVLSTEVDAVFVNATYDGWGLDVLAGVTAPHTIDFDFSRPDFDEDTTRGVYGAMVSRQVGQHRPFVYFLVQDDYNDDDLLHGGGATIRYEYDSFYIGAGSRGNLSAHLTYALEAVYQGGEGLSDGYDPEAGVELGQTYEDIEAGALDLRLDYLFRDPNRSRLTLEGILATGDSDRQNSSSQIGGNRSGTKDHAFNAWGLLNTGLAFSPSVSNLAMLRLGGSTFPFTTGSLKRLQVGLDVFLYGKLKNEGGIDEPTDGGSFLGIEPDLFVNWQITSDLSVALRYGVFFPGSAIESDEHPRNFFFAGVTLAF